MIRSLNDVLTTNLNTVDFKNIFNNPELELQKFILALKWESHKIFFCFHFFTFFSHFRIIHNSDNVDCGFVLLKKLQTLDTSVVIDPSFIEELLNPEISRKLSFANTLKIIDIILKNASQTGELRVFYRDFSFVIIKWSLSDTFEMAIHQNLIPYAQKSKTDSSSLNDVLIIINTIIGHLNTNKMTTEFLQTTCSYMIQLISRVPAARNADEIKDQSIERLKIVEFLRSLKEWPQINSSAVEEAILNQVYLLISREEEVSPLTSLGLIVIPEPLIGGAVNHLLQVNRFNSNQNKQIVNIVKRLVTWIRAMGNIVPMHIWAQKVLYALYNEGHYEIVNEIVFGNFIPCCLTMLMPMYQENSSIVVMTMLEVQKSEEILVKIMGNFLKVLENLEKTNPPIFNELMDAYADYMSYFPFPRAETLCRPAVEYLASHQRFLSHSAVKQRRLTAANAFGGNVKIGLENLGNSCYINSVIQALFMVKSFCRDLLTFEQADRQTMALQQIFALLMFSDRSELNVGFAMQHIRPQEFMPGLQHDSSEFMGSLLDKLHEANKKSVKESGKFDGEETEETQETEEATGMVDDSGINVETPPPDSEMPEFPMNKIVDNTSDLNESTIVQKNFGGKITTTCVCDSCKSKSTSIDSFRDLALSFPEKDSETEYSVQQLLDFYFTTEKLTLDGDNQYHCEKCKSLCDGDRHTELLQSPKNLILTLKHFRYDSRYHTRSKLLIKKMDHEEKIAVKVRASQDSNGFREVHYQLHSAVVHSGISLDSGHYYTFARDKEDWFKFNDSFVSTSSLQELLK